LIRQFTIGQTVGITENWLNFKWSIDMEETMYKFTAALGILLILAPFAMGYNDAPAAMWTSIILGLIAAGVSLYKGWVKDAARWEYMIAAVVGLLAVFAPFVLGFSAVTIAVWTTIILGALLAFLGGYEGFFAKPGT
jgi:lysylphosphatidylglycerol synthetase-like protein (DUF2156 family)